MAEQLSPAIKAAARATIALRNLKLAIEQERPFDEIVTLAAELVNRANEVKPFVKT